MKRRAWKIRGLGDEKRIEKEWKLFQMHCKQILFTTGKYKGSISCEVWKAKKSQRREVREWEQLVGVWHTAWISYNYSVLCWCNSGSEAEDYSPNRILITDASVKEEASVTKCFITWVCLCLSTSVISLNSCSKHHTTSSNNNHHIHWICVCLFYSFGFLVDNKCNIVHMDFGDKKRAQYNI